MRFHFVGRAPHNVHTATIGAPARNTRREVLVGVGDAAIVLFLEIVVGQIGIVAAAQPELLDELFPLFVGFQLQEGSALFRRNDVNNVFVQPLLVWSVELFKRLLHLTLLLFVHLLRNWRRVGLLRLRPYRWEDESQRKQGRNYGVDNP